MDIEITKCYKYLGVIVDEHIEFKECVKVLADSSGRALGAIVSKIKQLKDIGYNTLSKLYNTGVVPIMDLWFRNLGF